MTDKATLNIILIEDNPADVYLIKDYLNSSGLTYSLTHFVRLSDSLELISNQNIDIILLDLGLPDSWGINTLRKIQNIKISAAIIVLTGLDDEQTALKALNEGAQDYIVKNKLNEENILHAIKYGIERKKHQKELEILNDRLEQKVIARTKNLNELIATKDKFFGIIAHDLKNPFSAILGASELLLNHAEKFDTDNIKKISEMLNGSAKNIYSMLENLLEWARTQTSSIKYIPENIIVKDLIQENFLYIKAFADNKGISLYSGDLDGLSISADRNMLTTIIRNLLNNSIKFTHKGGKVSINATKDYKQVIFSIKDTGIGIPKEDIDKLFRIDVKFNNPGTDNESGTGLGLILCKEFIEKHNGKIWVDSEVNKGSEFNFSIPLIS